MPTYDEKTGVYSTFDACELQVVYAGKVIKELTREIKKEEREDGKDLNKWK